MTILQWGKFLEYHHTAGDAGVLLVASIALLVELKSFGHHLGS